MGPYLKKLGAAWSTLTVVLSWAEFFYGNFFLHISSLFIDRQWQQKHKKRKYITKMTYNLEEGLFTLQRTTIPPPPKIQTILSLSLSFRGTIYWMVGMCNCLANTFMDTKYY